MYFFGAYTNILQTTSEDFEWKVNIYWTKKHEVGGNWEGGGLLWTNSKAGSWFTNPTTNSFFIIMFKVGLQSYFKIAIASMK
jgi:hypothetical protein